VFFFPKFIGKNTTPEGHRDDVAGQTNDFHSLRGQIQED